MKNTPLSKIMTRKLITVSPGQSMHDVNDLFEKNHLHHVPVVEKGKIVGIISLLDFMRISLGFRLGFEEEKEVNENILNNLKITEVMTEHPICMSPDNTVKDAASLFCANMFHALPICENDKLVGIVTSTDVIAFLAGIK